MYFFLSLKSLEKTANLRLFHDAANRFSIFKYSLESPMPKFLFHDKIVLNIFDRYSECCKNEIGKLNFIVFKTHEEF